jgi:hypothetical protein
MQYSGPAQPKVVGGFADIIQHLQGMVKIIFMAFAVNDLHTVKRNHLRKYNVQQPGIKQVVKPD